MPKFSLVDRITVIYARKSRGKSYLGRWLLDESRRLFSSILVVCPTGFHSFWSAQVGEGAVHESYDAQLLMAILKFQRRRGKDGTLNADSRKILVVCDDCLSEINWKEKGPLLTLATSNRHYGIALLVMTQIPTGIPPVLRQNADYAFMMRSNGEDVRDLLYREYGTGVKKEWLSELDSSTQGFSYFVYDQNEDAYYTGIAREVPDRYSTGTQRVNSKVPH